MYAAKLSPPEATSDSGYDTSSSTSRRNDSISSASNLGLSMSVMDMDMVKVVANLFGLSLQEVQKQIHQIKHFCTEKAAMSDLKVIGLRYWMDLDTVLILVC